MSMDSYPIDQVVIRDPSGRCVPLPEAIEGECSASFLRGLILGVFCGGVLGSLVLAGILGLL